MARAALLHIINPELGQFYGGLLHVLLTLEHVLPLLVLGILAGFQGKAAARKILLIALLAALAGGVAGTWLQGAPAAEVLNILNLASFVVLGLLVAYGRELPFALPAVLSAVFAFAQGSQNLAGLPAVVSRLHFLPGVLAAIAGVLLIAAALALSLPKNWMRLGLRIFGSWVAALGLLMMALL
jgi:urease accessory protein